jgi:glycosyltransferase involved in cell wall biosynthesis
MKVVHKKKRKELLLYADFDCVTGFAQVAKNLVDNWSKDEDLIITVFALNNHSQQPYMYKENVKVIPAITSSMEKKDYLCRIELLNIIYKIDFDVVFFLNDIEVFSQMEEHLLKVKNEKKKEKRPPFKSIIYFPIDSEPRPSDLKVLNFFDEVVTYTEYAKGVMKPILSDTQFKKVKVISHGVDTNVFYPVPMFDVAKQAQLGIPINKDEKPFIFGTVNRNSARKDLASLIVGFALFKHPSNANAVLYLHCNSNDRAGINIERLCDRVGLEFGKDVIVPKDFNENKGVSSEELNLIYNSFDCFVTTTTAEGWGLSVTEAMATKKLVLCPKHTSLTEITDNGSLALTFMFSQQTVFVNDYEKIRYTTNPNEVATLLGVAYNLENDTDENKESVKGIIERAYEKVSKLNWEGIADEFKKLIDKHSK